MLWSLFENTRALGTNDILLVTAFVMVDGKLTVINPTYHCSKNGIRGISFILARDSFTVITGHIGAAKSTLLRVMLGLLPKDGGEIIWNGHSINDFAARFVPLQMVLQAAVLELDKMMVFRREERLA